MIPIKIDTPKSNLKSTVMKHYNYLLFAFFIIFSACSVSPDFQNTENLENPDTEEPSLLDIEQASIPLGFEFETHHEVTVNINDAKPNVRYDVYAYSEEKYFLGTETYTDQDGETVTEEVYRSDILNKLIFSGVPYNGILKQTVSIPKYYNELYVLRSDNLKYSSAVVDIVNQEANFNSSSLTGKSFGDTKVSDFLYGVNGSGELFQVDPLTGDLSDISTMPMGSWTCAIDQANKMLYSVGKSSPYPLMKYSIENNTWETVGNLGKGGPRLDYNYRDGLLYFANNDNLYAINPINADILSSWKIYGLDNLGGGDLAFAEDGTLFMCTFSGLYRLELDANNNYQSTRISADNLPFNPTSMTFDSNQELWLANSASSSDLIIMDTQTGGWQYRYGTNANNDTDFGRTINDLTTFRVYTEVEEDPDTDGDGIKDSDDKYPNDADKAFEVYTPSKYGQGTLAFEDLWPSTGDYDFNDVALNYQSIAVLNAQNLAVQIDFIFNVKANGASYTNGFGIEIENVSPSKIESITGAVLNQDYINVATNGTEENQENAVIIFFDSARSVLNQETTISIKFTEPISTTELGAAPFNPFMIINKIREKEVHLPNRKATSLGNPNFQIDGVNKDSDGNYITSEGLPWAISIIHDFKVPKEKVVVSDAYNHFVEWAASGGSVYQDWYKDSSGYRNEDMIEN